MQVQCGFGRVGSHFWGFELQSVVLDMVTLGKQIGNGFPMGAVIMSKQLAQGFSNGMEYFNTCGGCTGAAADGRMAAILSSTQLVFVHILDTQCTPDLFWKKASLSSAMAWSVSTCVGIAQALLLLVRWLAVHTSMKAIRTMLTETKSTTMMMVLVRILIMMIMTMIAT